MVDCQARCIPQSQGRQTNRRAFIQQAAAIAALTGARASIDTASVAVGASFVTDHKWGDATITFRSRAPAVASDVQLWCAFRCQGENGRYIVGLRGGNNNDLYIARYAPDGGIRFLGIAPLNFSPAAGTWYHLRIVAMGPHFHVYLNNENLPRLNVIDRLPLWMAGSVVAGGGWLPAEYADLRVMPLSGADKSAFLKIGGQCWAAPLENKIALRVAQRAAYQPARLAAFGLQRTELSLDGHWLFMPEYEIGMDARPIQLEENDGVWHVLNVPDFWTPGLSWLYGQTSFPYLKGVSRLAAVAESLDVQEARRVDGYTFDWNKTKAAWYRHYLELPDHLGDRNFELTFDAIAKVSEIWVNGIKVGGHTGLFAETRCDITHAVQPGRNVIAVHVISEVKSPIKKADNVATVAVTVTVTPEMLNSLPHGMLQSNVGGIWQPVKLTVTSPVRVLDCIIAPGMHVADITIDIANSGDHQTQLTMDYEIKSASDGTTLYTTARSSPVAMEIAAGAVHSLKFRTPRLSPKLWDPQNPNLYNLEISLKTGQQVLDRYSVRFGFRTFTRHGSQLLLNGHPYWLRGANPFPCNLKPNDTALAHRFTQLAHDGNIRAVRTHIIPFTAAWLNAADEIGMAVSYEGTWPWLMIQGPPPSAELLGVWMEEYLSLIKKYRNHPSIIIWDVNNEMNFGSFDQNDPVLLKGKWIVLDKMIRAIRKLDPTRPVVAYSGYTRKEAHKGYEQVVKPDGFDDGDIDDVHRYYGWYNPTFFHLYDGQYGKGSFTPGRPLISQEMGTGYPNNDDGHPCRHYLFNHYTPQSLVGDDAYENRDPAIFLARQAFMTKELGETLRRTGRTDTAGVMHFAYFTWFKTPWSATLIKPQPGYYAMMKVMQPVLVSAELFGRHFYAGSTVRRRVCIVNDAENYAAISAGTLTWEFTNGRVVVAHGTLPTPSVGYYQNHWMEVDFIIPPDLSEPRMDVQLVLRLTTSGTTISENSYDIVLATAAWAKGPARKQATVFVIDPHQRSSAILSDLKATAIRSVSAAHSGSLIIIGDPDDFARRAADVEQLREFLRNGGNVLMLHPGRVLPRLFPEQVLGFQAKQGEIVTIRARNSPVFAGIRPLDTAWFEVGGRHVPIACTGVHHVAEDRREVTALAAQCDIHGYLKKPADVIKVSGYPLVELRIGKGRLLASELYLDAGNVDPIARRLLTNILSYVT